MADQDTLSPEKERQILDGAGRVFALDGYEGASMSRIAAEASVSKGTLYNYFSGKADLFGAFVRRECTSGVTLLFDEIDESVPPEEMLTRIGRQLVAMLTSETGLVIYRMVVAEAGKFPELAEAFYRAGPERALARMASWVARMVETGRLEIADPEFAAEQLFTLMQSRLCMKRRLRLISTVSPEEIDQVVASAVRLFLRGYAPAH
jgi:TetR/AcrR family transcriptional repressor of mexJK operon